MVLSACSTNTAMLPNTGVASTATSDVQIPASIGQGVSSETLGPVHFSVALPLRNEAELTRLLDNLQDPASPQFRKFISNAEFVQRFAPTMASRLAVARELQRAGFRVTIADQAVMAGGTQTQVERYFRTSFQAVRYDSATVLAPRTPLALSRTLVANGATVIGLDGTPPMQRFSKSLPMQRSMRPDSIYGPYGPYFAADLKQAYQFPSYEEASGAGVTIGIVIDSPVSTSDVDDYFKEELSPVAPRLTDNRIDGGGTLGGSGTFEATLDVEQSGGMAPRASIVVFDIPDLSPQHIYDAYSAVAKDKSVIVVNSSFGGCELEYNSPSGAKALKMFDNVFKQGLSEGITWVAASGDHAALQCGSNENALGVSWPAVSPYVLGVGGTNLTTTYTAHSPNSRYVHEDAYADIRPSGGGDYWGSGGGYSKLYARPSWQNGFVSSKGRGVPDVAVHMGGEGFSSGGAKCQAEKCNVDDSSDAEFEAGQLTAAIGTSAASPDFVGLLALTAGLIHKRLGQVNAVLYAAGKKHPGYYFRRGLKGDNGYKTTSGLWDPVLGLGTPYGARIAGAKQVAGEPTSPSNP